MPDLDPALVQMLSRGADRGLKDFDGRGARELALALGRPELAALLG
jgi:hypothetical protein